MKELWWWCQQQKEDKCWYNLNHELLSGNLTERLATDRFEQPSADKEETWQTKQEECGIITQERVPHAKMAYMRIDHENHRESPHRINVFYPLLSHDECKDTNK